MFRSKNGRTPAKYGRYQRNICTFTESFVYYSVGQVVLLVSVLLLGLLLHLDTGPALPFHCILLYYLGLYLVLGCLAPLVITCRLRNRHGCQMTYTL